MIVLILIVLFFLLFILRLTTPTEIYTLSLHDALPIYRVFIPRKSIPTARHCMCESAVRAPRSSCCTALDRKSTRLNSSHRCISYAVFCLKKKKHTTDYRRFIIITVLGVTSFVILVVWF